MWTHLHMHTHVYEREDISPMCACVYTCVCGKHIIWVSCQEIDDQFQCSNDWLLCSLLLNLLPYGLNQCLFSFFCLPISHLSLCVSSCLSLFLPLSLPFCMCAIMFVCVCIYTCVQATVYICASVHCDGWSPLSAWPIWAETISIWEWPVKEFLDCQSMQQGPAHGGWCDL